MTFMNSYFQRTLRGEAVARDMTRKTNFAVTVPDADVCRLTDWLAPGSVPEQVICGIAYWAHLML